MSTSEKLEYNMIQQEQEQRFELLDDQEIQAISFPEDEYQTNRKENQGEGRGESLSFGVEDIDPGLELLGEGAQRYWNILGVNPIYELHDPSLPDIDFSDTESIAAFNEYGDIGAITTRIDPLTGAGQKGNTRAGRMLTRLRRLYDIERSWDSILQMILNTGYLNKIIGILGFDSTKEIVRYVLLKWTQSHLYVTEYSVVSDQITSINSAHPSTLRNLPHPPFPSHRSSDLTNKQVESRVERHMLSAISEMIWPNHYRDKYWMTNGRTEWDYTVTTIIKEAWAKTVYPTYLCGMMMLRRPIEVEEMSYSVNRRRREKYGKIVKGFERWITVVMGCTEGGEIWDYDVETENMLKVWGSLRDFRGARENDVFEPKKKISYRRTG
ncbi:hypothetical protein AA313_de0208866 [Arthrobotrys entomopaga]|nr:hypothetical protein AA313_de0208866 [Arthrobotrys entomopaga]